MCSYLAFQIKTYFALAPIATVGSIRSPIEWLAAMSDDVRYSFATVFSVIKDVILNTDNGTKTFHFDHAMSTLHDKLLEMVR